MQGDEFLPRDSFAEVTELYERLEEPDAAPLQLTAPPVQATQPSPVVVAPIAYVPMHRYEIPTIAPYGTGSSPQVRISERLDATHRVEHAPSWHRMALAAGIVGAIATGIAAGIVVSMGGTELEAAPAAAVVHRVAQHVTVTPIEVAPAAKRIALIDVRLESQPAGANATLIDGDKATPLGATPLAVELDPRRTYDVMVALSGHATKVVHVTPSADHQRVVVAFDEVGRHVVRHGARGAGR
jgi:hypothetical protein